MIRVYSGAVLSSSGTDPYSGVVFTLTANSYTCARGHAGDVTKIRITDVDTRSWDEDKSVTIRFEIYVRCYVSGCYYNKDNMGKPDATITVRKEDSCHMTRIGCAETQARGILAGKFSQTRRVRRRFLSRRSILRWGMISVLPTRITRPKRPHAAIAETLSTGNAAGASYITTTTRGQRSFWASTRRLMETITSRSRHIRCMITGKVSLLQQNRSL